jgi:N-acetylneuraminic acid mutarotase
MRRHLILLIVLAIAQPVFAQNWVNVTPQTGPAPTPRKLAGAVYDPAAHRMIVFAGEEAVIRTNEVWAFDLSSHTWTDITPAIGSAPVGRITPASVYDSDNHQMLMFSGQSQLSFHNDVWLFDLTSHTWTEGTPPGPLPEIRYGVASCYDPVSGTQVNFAGFTFQGRFDDTWRYDPDTDTWSDVSPATSPLERCLHAGAYDAQNRHFYIYGGQNGGALNDIWQFDLASEMWTEMAPSTVPLGRFFAVFEYDSNNHRMTMFSGNRGTLGLSNEVWVFDLTVKQWIALSPTGTAPVARDGAVGVYVSSEDRMVIFGGSSGGLLNDVWSLENLSDTATGIRGGGDTPLALALEPNHPNPFNPSTVIPFSVSEAGRVTLTVYDMRGRVVRTLVDRFQQPGADQVRWDGRNDAGQPVASGVYLYRLQAGATVESRKMTLLK